MSRRRDRGGGGLTMFEHRTLVVSLGVFMGAALVIKAVHTIHRWLHEELVELEDDLLGGPPSGLSESTATTS